MSESLYGLGKAGEALGAWLFTIAQPALPYLYTYCTIVHACILLSLYCHIAFIPYHHVIYIHLTIIFWIKSYVIFFSLSN